MNKILALFVVLMALRMPLQAQDAALVERVNKLDVYVQELQADKARQQKQITDLTREVESLKDQLNRANAAAKQEDVSALADSVRELERKHKEDMNSVATEIEKLGKSVASRHSQIVAGSRGPTAEQGYPYTIQQGDTLSAIVAAYRKELNLKISVDDVLKANPGLKPTSMPVGKEIFIPAR